MRLLTFAARATPGEARVGAMLDGRVLDLRSLEVLAARRGEQAVIPGSMKGLLKLEGGRRRVADLLDFARAEPAAVPSGALLSEADIIFLPPVMESPAICSQPAPRAASPSGKPMPPSFT